MSEGERIELWEWASEGGTSRVWKWPDSLVDKQLPYWWFMFGRYAGGYKPFGRLDRAKTQQAAEAAFEKFGFPVDVYFDQGPPPFAENPPRAPAGWKLSQQGRADVWTSPDGTVQIIDAARRPHQQRWQVHFLKSGRWLEDVGWPSLPAAIEYATGKRSLRARAGR